MRVIAGAAKGIRLCAPKGSGVRPTREKVREALFSILAPRLPGSRFLDLFAGTGVNGIEALSRGAQDCTFVDSDARAAGIVRRNIEISGFHDRARMLRLTLPREMHKVAEKGGKFDVIFADPPYAGVDYEAILDAIRVNQLLHSAGVIVLEHSSRTDLLDVIAGYSRTRCNVYGETALSFFS